MIETNNVVERLLADIASEEADSGGPDDGNPWHTFTTRISDVKALLAERQSLSDHIDVLEGALWDIESFTNGYGDVAGIACRMAAKALRPESFIDEASLTQGGKTNG